MKAFLLTALMAVSFSVNAAPNVARMVFFVPCVGPEILLIVLDNGETFTFTEDELSKDETKRRKLATLLSLERLDDKGTLLLKQLNCDVQT